MLGRFPSKEKLRELRARGVYPWSYLALRLALVAGVLGVLIAAAQVRSAIVSVDLPRVLSGEPLEGVVAESVRGFIILVVATAIAAVLIGMSCALVQTKGAYGIEMLRSASTSRSSRRRPISALVALGVVVTVACMSVYLLAPEAVAILRLEGADAVVLGIERFLSKIAKVVVVVTMVLAVLLVFVGKGRFLLEATLRTRGARREE